MYIIEFYEDKNGKSEVRDFFTKLSIDAKTDKNARIKNDLRELRPLSNRIFFFYWKDNKFVLLHHYIKKSQKTPRKELKKALNHLNDWIERKG